HSKWKNIQHRKGAQDAKRGKVFTKLIKEITVAVKTGGGGDVDANPRLRLAVQNARGVNMPKDTIDRAIKKASGMGGADFIETTFEGYGANGIAILVESATDNNTRTVANIRSYFNKYGGSLGKDGCLQFIFERKGIFIIPPGKLDEEEFTMEMIDAGAEDVEFPQEQGDEYITISSGMEEFGSIQKKLDELKIEPVEAGLEQIPTTYKEVNQETYDKAMKLIDVIEDDDDVQKVYHNMDLDE
ncbi:MAG: YebC/PmpR family DNA-binding transcriptional regulator, partial [Bdellovibrionales bacterium]|nr:YebC/PmpR family DNA-binding transcriptional regulator [Bdellovibrionales bacterium]